MIVIALIINTAPPPSSPQLSKFWHRSRIVRIKACFKSSSFSCVSFISLLSTTKCFLAFFNYSRIITKRALKKKLAGRSQILLLELELRSSIGQNSSYSFYVYKGSEDSDKLWQRPVRIFNT
ncbi:uncharacterized protein LOC109836514 isoform X2 [Asparagus officinalis]|uniref:uncharacterized protein LOC109836514 isoform X2 n=1 Tax=Asparagus officinalis TaxID=4686 RepID=UPI00098E0BA5|nr:uncharacterized protein LOC109836514 isoform X2 [Asparagus officinalis]